MWAMSGKPLRMTQRATGGRWLPLLITLVYRAWSATWRVRLVDREVLESALSDGATVICLWHGEQAPLLHAHGHRNIWGMASKSADGELLARIIERLGYGVIRGSSSTGALGALRDSIRAIMAGCSPALAVDGPRGPRHIPHHGAMHLAARTGRPVVYMVSRASFSVQLKTWDRFLVPLPGARVTIGYGRMEPPGKAKQEVERASEELGRRMAALSERLVSRPS